MSDECITHGVTYPSHGRCPQCQREVGARLAPESPAPQSAGLSAEEVARLVEEMRVLAAPIPFNLAAQHGLRLATALEATAARLVAAKERVSWFERSGGVAVHARFFAVERERDALRSTLAERERELGDARASLNCVGCGAALECATDLRRERDALRTHLSDMEANTVNAMEWLEQKERADAAERQLAESLAKLAAAERVVEAARVVSSAFFYIPREADAALRDALKGYDALSRS